MDLRFDEIENGRYKVLDGDKQIGICNEQTDGSYGYSIFGTMHMGKESSIEDVQKELERRLD